MQIWVWISVDWLGWQPVHYLYTHALILTSDQSRVYRLAISQVTYTPFPLKISG